MNRISKDEYYLGIAEAVSRRSTCLKSQYGAVIVNNDEIISTGYNGSARGELNCCDTGKCIRIQQGLSFGERYDLCVSVHAEQNAVISAARKDMQRATLYLFKRKGEEICYNPTPCYICLRLIKNAGIKRVVVYSAEAMDGHKIISVKDI